MQKTSENNISATEKFWAEKDAEREAFRKKELEEMKELRSKLAVALFFITAFMFGIAGWMGALVPGLMFLYTVFKGKDSASDYTQQGDDQF